VPTGHGRYRFAGLCVLATPSFSFMVGLLSQSWCVDSGSA